MPGDPRCKTPAAPRWPSRNNHGRRHSGSGLTSKS
ncbi:hypothetical protein CPTSoftv3_016 [Klebsiella phage Soft]|uniref:Uncharacterized protein n=1 Tax=Klebsiella phage Soft TaxID=2601626 RepID=A0A5C1K9Z1_9CAUD|nr:hypothetical protein HWC61_gp16 [Klebsiella phage Soft]QEM42134.1 hypothetical protein CPTSoftv3_016 [Klebsiella phage Soft]